MYKIMYILTGHIFELPSAIAKELKSKYPNDYKILEKDGKKYRERVKKVVLPSGIDEKSIYNKVKED